LARFRFVDLYIVAVYLLAIELHDSPSGSFVKHINERKPERFTGIPIGEEIDRVDFAMLLEQVSDLLLGRAEGQICYIYILGRTH
jgi:hypothetical protein